MQRKLLIDENFIREMVEYWGAGEIERKLTNEEIEYIFETMCENMWEFISESVDEVVRV